MSEFKQQDDTKTCLPDTVTITLSRESAEALHRYYPAEDRPHELELDAALRAALGER